MQHPDSLIQKLFDEFEKARSRNWDKFYITVDLHGTVLESSYDSSDISKNFIEGAISFLQKCSRRSEDLVLILDTSSHKADIEKYLAMFETLGIHFSYVDENPEQVNTAYANFADKYYFNLRLDDKAGFNPAIHWKMLEEALDKIPVLTGPQKMFEVTGTVMRIQSPFGPHEGHMKQIIRTLFERGKEVVIFLAIDRSYVSQKNPLGFDERKFMLDKAISETEFRDRQYSVLPLINQRSNSTWSHLLDTTITSHIRRPNLAPEQVGLIHSRDGFGRHYFSHGRFILVEVPEIKGVNATNLRNEVVTNRKFTSDYIRGLVAQQMKAPAVILYMQTRCVIRNSDRKIGIIQYRSDSETKFRFPGGYFSPEKDTNFEGSLERKLNLKLSNIFNRSHFTYVGNTPIDDWRHREAGGRCMCMVYETSIDESITINDAHAGPKLSELRFVDHDELKDLIDEEELSIIPLIKSPY